MYETDRNVLTGSMSETVADSDPHTSDTDPGAQGAPMTSDAPAHGGAVTGGRDGDTVQGADTMNDRSRPATGSEATAAGVRLAQSGWHVIADGGDDLGLIARIDGDHIVVDRSGFTTPDELTIPRDLIAEEDEASMQVFLSVDRHTADQFATGS